MADREINRRQWFIYGRNRFLGITTVLFTIFLKKNVIFHEFNVKKGEESFESAEPPVRIVSIVFKERILHDLNIQPIYDL